MGTVASDKDDERDASESSGYTDLMEIANALGMEDDDAAGHDDANVVDDLEPIGAGYGGAAAAALITDASAETPAANASEPASGTIRREPPPPPPRRPSAVVPASDPKLVAVAAPAEPPIEKPIEKPVTAPEAASAAALLRPAVAPVLSESPAASRASAAPRAVASTPAQPAESKKGGLIIAAVAGMVALGGVFWYLNQDKDAAKNKVTKADVRAAAATPEEPAVDPAEEAAKKAAADAAAAKAAADAAAAEAAAAEAAAAEAAAAEAAAAEAAAAEAAAAAAAAEAAAVEVSVSQKKKGDKTKPEPSATPEPVADAPKEPPPKPEPLTPGEIDEKFRAECVLNPNKAGCEEIRKKARNTTDLDATLSDKLTASQIREGFSSVKGKAKACGGETGVTVRVKVSIAGDTGNVISADALDDHAGTALGKCVVDALKGASFPRFTSGVQGTVYPVSF